MRGIKDLAEVRVGFAKVGGKQGVEADLEQRQAGVPRKPFGGEALAATRWPVEKDTAARLQPVES